MEGLRRCWAEIDLDRIAHNCRTLRRTLAPQCKFMAVVKADAYGHGDGPVAAMLEESGAADWFGVSGLGEALSLRRQGIQKPVLVFGYTPPEHAAILAKHRITQAVYSLPFAAALSQEAQRAGVEIDCHIKLDTGMGRLGLNALPAHTEEAAAQAAQICALPALSCTGIFTHFACADEAAQDSCDYTQAQYDAFVAVIALLERRGITFALRHCCNSAGTIRYPQMQLDMVRVGVALYGLSPSPDCDGLADLRPALSFYARVSAVKEAVDGGAFISYGRRYQTDRPGKTLAAVTAGYADGYRRVTNRGRVLIGGKYAPVVGRVCMDQMLVDISDIPGVREGDLVVLAGQSGEHRITLDELAQLHGTINYEEACLLTRRVLRVFLKDGKEVAVRDYLNIT